MSRTSDLRDWRKRCTQGTLLDVVEHPTQAGRIIAVVGNDHWAFKYRPAEKRPEPEGWVTPVMRGDARPFALHWPARVGDVDWALTDLTNLRWQSGLGQWYHLRIHPERMFTLDRDKD